MSARSLYGVVLCGGKSSRMGSEKALLEYQNKPLIEHVQETLCNIKHPRAVSEVLLSGTLNGYACVPDIIPDRGPLGGLHGVSAAVPADVDLLVVPVDMPRLTATVLEELLQAFTEEQSLGVFCGYELPLIIRVDARMQDYLARALGNSNARHSLRALIEHYGANYSAEVVARPAESEALFLNVNGPEEWQCFLSRYT